MTPTEIKTLRVLAESNAWMTKKELTASTGAARRTLYLAVKNLVENGLVVSKPSLRDTRQFFHGLTDLGRVFAKEVQA